MAREENPGAWVITDVFSKGGVRITIKASGKNSKQAIDDLYEGITYGIETFGWTVKTPEAPTAPKATIPLTDENGAQVVDGDGNTQTIELPDGMHVYTIKELFHAKSKDGSKDLLKVVTNEPPYNGKYGVTAFGTGGKIEGWKGWAVNTRYTPPANVTKVIIQDPEEGEKYATVKDFR